MLIHETVVDFDRYELHVETATLISTEDGDTGLLWTRIEVLVLRIVRFQKRGPRFTANMGVMRSNGWLFNRNADTANISAKAFDQLNDWFQANKVPLLRWVAKFPFIDSEGGGVRTYRPWPLPPERR